MLKIGFFDHKESIDKVSYVSQWQVDYQKRCKLLKLEKSIGGNCLEYTTTFCLTPVLDKIINQIQN